MKKIQLRIKMDYQLALDLYDTRHADANLDQRNINITGFVKPLLWRE